MSYKVVRVTDNLVNLLRRCCEAVPKAEVARQLGISRFTIYTIVKGEYTVNSVPYSYLETARGILQEEVKDEEFEITDVPSQKEVARLSKKCSSRFPKGIPGLIRRIKEEDAWKGKSYSAIHDLITGRYNPDDPRLAAGIYALLKQVSKEPAPALTRASAGLVRALYRLTDETPTAIMERWGIDESKFATAIYKKNLIKTVPIKIKEIFERQAVLSPADDFYGAIKHEIIDTRIARTAKEFRRLLPILSEHIDKDGSVDSLYSASFWSDRILLEKQHYRLMMLADLKHSKNHLQRQVRWEDFKKTLDVFRKARYSDDNICRIIGISDIHELLTPVNGTIKALAEGESIDDLARWLRNYHPKTQDISINTAKSYLREEGKDPALRGITYRFLMEREGKDPLALEEPEEEDDEPEFAGPTAEEIFAARFMDYNPSYRLTAYVPDHVWAKLREANKIETTDKKGEPLVDSRTFELKKLEVLLNSDLSRGRDTSKRELAKRKILRKIQ